MRRAVDGMSHFDGAPGELPVCAMLFIQCWPAKGYRSVAIENKGFNAVDIVRNMEWDVRG